LEGGAFTKFQYVPGRVLKGRAGKHLTEFGKRGRNEGRTREFSS
jgi:hypothetical protein